MSKQTKQQFERKNDVIKGKLFKRDEARPPIAKELVKFNFHGIAMEAYLSPGQIINPAKEYKRQFGRKYTGIHRNS